MAGKNDAVRKVYNTPSSPCNFSVTKCNSSEVKSGSAFHFLPQLTGFTLIA